MPKHRMTCCCCGASCGTWEQWPNRDTGYGLCSSCGKWIPSRPNFALEAEGSGRTVDAEMEWLYGVPGVHRPFPDTAVVIEWPAKGCGNWWVVNETAHGKTPLYQGKGQTSTARQQDAKAWMAQNPTA